MLVYTVPPGVIQSEPILCPHCAETFTVGIPHEEWNNANGDFEIRGDFLTHLNCGFSWHKDHRDPEPENETCPLCAPRWLSKLRTGLDR